MQLIDDDLLLSATDLSKHLACRHATSLDLKAARGEIARIYRRDPSIEVLEERGRRHEAAYLAYLQEQGHDILLEGGGLERTRDAMKSGVGVIPQADLQNGRWRGRADILLKVAKPSHLGPWSYEVVETKLASETRGATILQLCLYSELVAEIQGRMPDRTHVVSPGRAFQPETFRLQDFLAYYRFVKSRLATAVDRAGTARDVSRTGRTLRCLFVVACLQRSPTEGRSSILRSGNHQTSDQGTASSTASPPWPDSRTLTIRPAFNSSIATQESLFTSSFPQSRSGASLGFRSRPQETSSSTSNPTRSLKRAESNTFWATSR